MPWNKVEPMDEKIRFISDYLNRVFTFTELCDRYQISRKTGYKWIHRYEEEGASGLEDRARTPRRSPQKVPEAVEEAILTVRRHHPGWGPKKILALLERQRQPGPLPHRADRGEDFEAARLRPVAPKARPSGPSGQAGHGANPPQPTVVSRF